MATRASNGPQSAQARATVDKSALRKQIASAVRWAFQAKDSLLKRASSSNYSAARAYYMRKLDRSARNRRGLPLLVYNMGKVGSKTVIRSLRELARSRQYSDDSAVTAALDMPLYHVHFLTQTLIDEYLEKRKRFLGTAKQGRLEHIWLYEYLREQLDRGLESVRFQAPHSDSRPPDSSPLWKVVTLTRETVGRNISNFFEWVDVEPLDTLGSNSPDELYPGDTGSRYRVRSDPDFYDFELEVDTKDLSPLLEVFLQYQDHDGPLKFFEEEIKGVLGIDVYETPFLTRTLRPPPGSASTDGLQTTDELQSAGYAIYRTDLVDLLLIRVEDLDRCADKAFSEFLGIPELPLINENVGSDKAYASLYKIFKDSVKLPESYVDQMYSTQYMRHFYSESEIAAFKKRWIKAPDGGPR